MKGHASPDMFSLMHTSDCTKLFMEEAFHTAAEISALLGFPKNSLRGKLAKFTSRGTSYELLGSQPPRFATGLNQDIQSKLVSTQWY